MSLYQIIKETSEGIDWTSSDISSSLSIKFPVPKTHPRSSVIEQYYLTVAQLSNYHLDTDDLVLCDESIRSPLTEQAPSLPPVIFLEPTEGSLKTITHAEEFISSLDKEHKRIVVIGGGILCNFGGYIAEKLNTDLVYIPTTIIAMSDACIGGKVRINDIQAGKHIKHAHKSFYEPSEIVIDPQFLDSLNNVQIRTGLAEIIKHAVYQSPSLANYLLSDSFDPFTDKQSLLRAILWTADLKRICLKIDPEESKDGSYKILRAAHDVSDKLEEESGFTLSHGKAVEKAMIEDLYSNKEKYNLLVEIYTKLGIGYTTVF